jgi:hypothetical protein
MNPGWWYAIAILVAVTASYWVCRDDLRFFLRGKEGEPMHATIGQIRPADSDRDRSGWHSYIPSIFSYRNVVRQIGKEPTLYVMRKKVGRFRSEYRECTPAELSEIETNFSRR